MCDKHVTAKKTLIPKIVIMIFYEAQKCYMFTSMLNAIYILMLNYIFYKLFIFDFSEYDVIVIFEILLQCTAAMYCCNVPLFTAFDTNFEPLFWSEAYFLCHVTYFQT